ncbi:MULTISPECIES: GspE/PulE family protein [unclassified Rhizobium]|uniref:GspE/PulE family protein n=1 Tax=unclassified Rhizobium TaxID=2613769 RepID=UPI00160D1127|nr:MULTISPECIES: GspE/PulE family protein [unclassified Rhizobium]MBB3318056.1 general secretion pathway protein E [Rhizobium sp. BK181]MBB3544218.1 general secretion pathway protein E [Rhizobium sp. BK399]MCS3742998.1 general secretion pathway protein E [Rhizobium sp. BK661]MCS4096553.1 general secretion pathway protein E [Rhizobium sp. BK176]
MATATTLTDFVRYLTTNDNLVGPSERVSLERMLKAPPSSYSQIWETGVLSGDQLAEAIGEFHGLGRAAVDQIEFRPELTADLSPRFLRAAWALPALEKGQQILVIADPTREEAIEAAAAALGQRVEMRVATFEEMAMLFERLLSKDRANVLSPADQTAARSQSAAEEDLDRLHDLASGAPIVRAVDQLLETALNLSATDIHIEPQPDGVRVRMRVDGMLRTMQPLSNDIARGVVSRIKILAGLNIAEHRLPQDGRARITINTTRADFRVATMPTLHGEALVARILVKGAEALDLSRLGMAARDFSILRTQIAEPHGLIVVAGPTGCGKTTTLTAALSSLNSPERKIMTIEDPIEYQIAGVSQTQVKPSINLTFANAMRSFLRQDPDIMMVGEMRDSETASIGIQAALTGHLVLTTLHTNSAADAIIRLMDLGVETFLLASALRCVIAQRLVRRLCERCRAPVNDGAGAEHAALARRGFVPRPGDSYFRAVGCAYCGESGYRGRVGIFEVLPVDAELSGLMRDDVDPQKIQTAAVRAGMTTMLDDGFAKYRKGITSIEEVLRVTI